MDRESRVLPGQQTFRPFRADKLFPDEKRQDLAGNKLSQPRVVYSWNRAETARGVKSALRRQEMDMRIPAVQVAFDDFLDDGSEKAAFLLEPSLILRQELAEMTEQHPVEHGLLRMSRAIDSRHGGRKDKVGPKLNRDRRERTCESLMQMQTVDAHFPDGWASFAQNWCLQSPAVADP